MNIIKKDYKEKLMKDIKAFLKKGKKLFSRERYKNLS